MAIPELFASGVVPQKGDTKRMLLAKRLNNAGGVALKSDTIRMLRAKTIKVLNGGDTTSGGI